MSGEKAEAVTYELGDGVATVTLNRPEKRNALNADVTRALVEAFEHAGDDGARVALLAGNGAAFSAGADLEALLGLQTASYDDNLRDSRLLAGLFRTMREAPYPIIAVVHGPAFGGGAGLVAASDFSVAARGVEFGFTEVQVGFVPAIVMTFVMQRLRGCDARDILLSGRRFGTDEALAMGLVTKVVESDQLREEARQYARRIADHTSGEAVAATKHLMDELWGRPLSEALELAAEANARARQTDDFREGVSAFLDRRKPGWRVEGGSTKMKDEG